MADRRPEAYIGRYALTLRPDIDAGRLGQAWKLVFEARPILRTRIVTLGSRLVQVVVNERFCLDGDTSTHPVMNMGDRLSYFSLIHDPTDGSRRSVLRAHHAIYDGVSLGQLFADVAQAYTTMALDHRPSISRFIHFLEDYGSREAGREYWESQFQGLETNYFPIIRPRDHKPTPDKVFTRACTVATKGMPNSRFAAYLRAAWALVLSGWAGSTDVVFGAVVSGRNQSIDRVREILAPTLKMVPVRVNIENRKSVGQFVEDMFAQAQTMKAYEHVGFHSISQMGDEAREACNFQTVFSVQPCDYASVIGGHLGTWKSTVTDTLFSSHAISTEAIICNGGVNIRATYDSQVIEQWAMERMIAQFCSVIEQLLTKPSEQSLRQIEMVADEDVEDIWKLNAELPPAVDSCVHGLIEQTVQKQPQAPAVCAWDGELTYSELDSLSTQLSLQLGNHGVRPETIVALCFEKSMWMPVAMLGVMKAGGAMVCLDVNQPEERLRTVVAQARSALVVASAASEQLARRVTNTGPVILASWQALESKSQDTGRPERASKATPSNLLLACFTSGSTGTPKGAKITHGNFSTALLCHVSMFGLGREDRVYDFSSYSFDFGVHAFLLAAVSGGCLCVPSEADRRGDLVASMEALRSTFVFLPPSVVKAVDLGQLPRLRMLIVGGESVDHRIVMPLLERIKVFNVYGPTECTVLATGGQVTTETAGGYIGRGMATNTWVARGDDAEQLCGVGMTGELVLEGPLVASGYLDDAARTAAAFVKDPPWLLRGAPRHPGRQGSRLYRTGDLVRMQGDGSLIFIGRKDGQVKVRGQRVELGEAEHHVHDLLRGPTRASSQVTAETVHLQGTCRRSLVVFIAPLHGAAMGDDELRATVEGLTQGIGKRLASRVPAYMVPTAYIPLRSTPLTASAKVDRVRLRRLAEALTPEELQVFTSRSTTQPSQRSPRAGLEQQLAKLWAEVLGRPVEQIDAHDSFTDLGGDSISIMQLAAAGRRAALSLAASQIIATPRLSDMAEAVQHTAILDDVPAPFSLLSAYVTS